jgi:2-keto-3-deoxy-L-rhamnonate aldolase RhmA
MQINKVKQALREGKTQVGCGFGQLRSAEVARALAAAGFDWTFIDTEHGGFDIETVQDLCRAATLAGLCPVVRPADLQYPLISRALDCGAQGVMLPRVEDPEVLKQAVSWTLYPPAGVRGWGLGPSQVGYRKGTAQELMESSIQHANANTLVIFQIETVLGVERREALLSVPGVDAVLIGPADLSVSLGIPGQFEHPKLHEAIEKIRDTATKHGVATGIHFGSTKLVNYWRDRGLRLLSCGMEIGFLFERASEVASSLRG